ncbi:hypothetical protein Psuf_087390 [Phytohabitans suffuscus]|uniref:Uncharacterized protein n=1 Tax=Phytohabitans suffuscus TaxID=624315 RepID=A0A6F8YZD4_9ACTN|nr:hypothetical protein Psuf_087390 [Phytohabitans suffuscus]
MVDSGSAPTARANHSLASAPPYREQRLRRSLSYRDVRRGPDRRSRGLTLRGPQPNPYAGSHRPDTSRMRDRLRDLASAA